MSSTLLYIPSVEETKVQVETGYEKDPQKTVCKNCNSVNKGKLCGVLIDRFPRVMEMRVEFKNKELQNAVSWGKMGIPRYLIWSGMRYQFLGMILRDSTEDAEHFSSYVDIGNKLFIHRGDPEGHLQLSNTTAELLNLSTEIFKGSSIHPSRFYYIKYDETDGPAEWTGVHFERRRKSTGLRGPVIDLDNEPEAPSDRMDIDG